MMKCSVFRWYYEHHTSTQTTATNTALLRVCHKQRCPATTPPVLDVSAEGGPEGVTPTPTELKMRSRITTFSVKFSAFPTNRNLRAAAKSVRPRAKSFIRSISQIEANRQKFSLSMTSEVRKCPKSVKSDRNSGVFAFGHRTPGVDSLLRCIRWKDAHARCRIYG